MTDKTLDELNSCSKADFVAALANIFEYSPWIAEKAAEMIKNAPAARRTENYAGSLASR